MVDIDNSADWDAEKQARRHEKNLRRSEANRQWPEAKAIAEAHGLRLIPCTMNHYQLVQEGGFLVNLYPCNCWVWIDPTRPKRPPFVNLSGEKWTLVQVVQAFCDRLKEGVPGAE